MLCITTKHQEMLCGRGVTPDDDAPDNLKMTLAKITGMIDTKISVGALALLFVNIVGVIVYIMINLSSIQTLVVKVDKILATQELMGIALPLQKQEMQTAERDIEKLKSDTDRNANDVGIAKQAISNLSIKVENIQNRFDDMLQASGSRARVRTPQGSQ